MTQVFREDGTVVPVTRVKAGPCVVTQVKKKETDGVHAVQVGFGSQESFRVSQAVKGHLKGLDIMRHMRDVRIPENQSLNRGDVIALTTFVPGDKVQVVGTSKGKGFQGVVKRHGFAGSPASHGHKDQLRMPGSIGATDAARVFKGTRMGGHMGDDRVTVKNLEIVEVREEDGELLIKGAVPGGRGGLLVISGEGELVIAEATQGTEAPAEEATPAEPAQEEAQQDAPAEEPAGEEVAAEQADAPAEEAEPAASTEEETKDA
jgi:large subunit ribosomal protein L3